MSCRASFALVTADASSSLYLTAHPCATPGKILTKWSICSAKGNIGELMILWNILTWTVNAHMIQKGKLFFFLSYNDRCRKGKHDHFGGSKFKQSEVTTLLLTRMLCFLNYESGKSKIPTFKTCSSSVAGKKKNTIITHQSQLFWYSRSFACQFSSVESEPSHIHVKVLA